jgi:hypothetical protein
MATDAETNDEAGSVAQNDSEYETTVSGSWWYAVAGGLVLWAVVVVLSLAVPSAAGVGGFLGLIGWLALPGGMYFDSKYVRANSQWDPRLIGWLLGSIIPLINLFVGAAYLYRRHEVLGVP